MFDRTAELYDLIYSSFKDFAAEAREIAGLLAREAPAARTILDVACGTGEHARLLAQQGDYRIDGLDLQPEFVALAAGKNPDGSFVVADMTAFDLGRSYDVVLCLFSSIGYVRTLDNVRRTLACFRRHLAPGGVIIVEPWFTPERWLPGRVSTVVAKADGIEVVRMSRAGIEDGISTIEFEYLVGTAAGIEHRSELHRLGLFTVAEMQECFRAAGLDARYEPEGLTGRGLYIARA